MDQGQTKQTQPGQPIAIPHRPPIEEELKRVNLQMYEQNVELSIRNRTLQVLRKMYEIINTSLGIEETAQKLIDAIVNELKFQGGFIALLEEKNKLLRIIGASTPSSVGEIARQRGIPVRELTFLLSNHDNYCVSTVLDRKNRMTNFLSDILIPIVDEVTAEKIQMERDVKTSFLFPLIFGNSVLGVLTLGMNKHVGDLSRAERDTLKELIEVAAIAIERAQIYADLQTANERLKQNDQLKDDFISVTSHELRTPMTAIKSYCWMVLHDKAGPIEQKAREYLERVYISTERLINLVNDMLDVSRIESGKIQLKIEQFDIMELTNEVTQEFHARSAERSLAVKVEHEDTIPKVTGDREITHQVLENLVGNAFKFTPEGGTITIRATHTDSIVQISVSDTGRGIAKEDLPRLFTKFGRLNNSLVSISESGGTGLGLFISKQYIELQKGKIWATSDIGQGATFWFTLPRA